uniref:ARAD1A09658p n=1 Tax=Blastobotrys adeninivorans TaxID=409370 RepID=A0A060SX08_BLAAD
MISGTILIIGGTSGIGFEVAKKAIEEGAKVVVVSSNQDKVDSAVAELGASASGAVADLENGDPEAALKPVFEKHAFNHVILTAEKRPEFRKLADIDVDYIRRTYRLKVEVGLIVAKLVQKYLPEDYKSSYIMTGGSATDKPVPGWSVASGATAALTGLVKALALDLAPRRVNVVAPGAVDTPLWGEKTPEVQAMLSHIGESLPLKKVATSAEVAEAYLYLLKDTNATASIVNTNGGGLL